MPSETSLASWWPGIPITACRQPSHKHERRKEGLLAVGGSTSQGGHTQALVHAQNPVPTWNLKQDCSLQDTDPSSPSSCTKYASQPRNGAGPHSTLGNHFALSLPSPGIPGQHLVPAETCLHSACTCPRCMLAYANLSSFQLSLHPSNIFIFFKSSHVGNSVINFI